MDATDTEELKTRLRALRQEHRDLDSAIEALGGMPSPDHLQIKRFKIKKLAIRDQILRIEDTLFPDIIA